jgi:hypothetical protein
MFHFMILSCGFSVVDSGCLEARVAAFFLLTALRRSPADQLCDEVPLISCPPRAFSFSIRKSRSRVYRPDIIGVSRLWALGVNGEL